ncbi:IS66 family transposase [Clostridium sp. Marseille-QA1073]
MYLISFFHFSLTNDISTSTAIKSDFLGSHLSKYSIAKRMEGYHVYLTTDAYAGYEKVDNIKRNLCWAHCRRYMI